jgi:hypothetical protein
MVVQEYYLDQSHHVTEGAMAEARGKEKEKRTLTS